MSSKSDTDATYCSEEEHLVKLTDISSTADVGQPQRRSQRLSQKTTKYDSWWYSSRVINRSKPVATGSKSRKESSNQYNENTLTPVIFSPTDIREDQDPNDSVAMNQKPITVSQKRTKTFSRNSRSEPYLKVSPHPLNTNRSSHVISSLTQIQDVQDTLPLQKKSVKVARKRKHTTNKRSHPLFSGNSLKQIMFLPTDKKEAHESRDTLILQQSSVINDDAVGVSVAKNGEEQGVPLDLSTKKSEECLKTSKPVDVNDNIPISIENTSIAINVIQGTSGPVMKIGDGTEYAISATHDLRSVQMKRTDIKDISINLGEPQINTMEAAANEFDIGIPILIKSNAVQNFNVFQSDEEALFDETPGTSGTIKQTKRKRGKRGRRHKGPVKARKRNAKKPVGIVSGQKNTKTPFRYYENWHKLQKLNGNRRNQELSKTSMLPDIYPPHFKYQLPPEAVLTQPLIPPPTGIMTPDETQSFDLKDSTSTSPSLPESLRGIFGTDDLRHLLDIEKVTYRLYDYHVQALAMVLNLRDDYLRELLDKILKIDPSVIRKINMALNTPFVQDHDLFERTISPDIGSQSHDAVPNSNSPVENSRIEVRKSKRRKLC